MTGNAIGASTPWYRTLSREQWRVLVASNLGWLFDGFEIYAIFLTVGFALHQLLDPSQYKAIPQYAGYILAGTVAGWATGGVIGGIIADYIGRKKTMMLAILAYSLTTGLSALAWDWPSFLLLRFLVGVGIGSEWATGASIVSEMWPDHARGKGGGLLQMGAGIGSVLASLIWLGIGDMGPNAWRWLYLIGVLPALIVLWIRRNIPESERWEEANARRRFVRARRQSGAALEGADAQMTRSTIVDLFTERSVRWRFIGAFLMMLSVTFAFWGVATFIPTYVGTVAKAAGYSAPTLAAWAGLLSAGAGIFGFVSLGFFADAFGRKAAAMLFYLASLVLTPVVYLWAPNLTVLLVCVTVFGFFSIGIWAWAPIWLPELFPTRMRGTAIAVCFNGPRFIAWIGPLIAGTLIVSLGGFGPAATIIGLFFLIGPIVALFMPETNGKPLPHALWHETAASTEEPAREAAGD